VDSDQCLVEERDISLLVQYHISLDGEEPLLGRERRH
jgi:hypothetical protein